MDPSAFSNQHFGYDSSGGRPFDDKDAMMDTFAPPEEQGGMDPNPSDTMGLMPPPSQINQENKDETNDPTIAEEEQEGGDDVFSVDWTACAAENLNKALEGYKQHAKSLFEAITAFVEESTAVHAEWTTIRQAEHAESQRLDEVAPDVYQATAMGGTDLYGGGMGEHDEQAFVNRDPTSSS